jgi:Flp pilus assembly protein TadB
MTLVLLAGAVAGLGVLLLGLVIITPKTNPAAALARLDAERERARHDRFAAAAADPGSVREAESLRKIGRRVASLLDGLGLDLSTMRGDLSLLGRSVDAHLAATLLAALGGFFLPVVIDVVFGLVRIDIGAATSLGAGLFLAAIMGAVPTLTVRSQAAERRRDFRHVVGSFLDLVAMNLSGGRGVPEALQSAADLSDGWAMVRIRDTLLTARLHGVTPWAALGELGDEIRIDELRDLAAALALVAEDGAKVRESLAARASSLRRRELAEVEGKAGERSQSMLVAQLLLALGFLVFLLYPAIMGVLSP